jgi:surface polysaccharide O-acyltransferase-like enzyme
LTRQLIVDDLASFFSFFTVFVYGFVIFSDERLSRAIHRHAWAALLLGILTSGIYLFVLFSGRAPRPGQSFPWTLYMVLRGFNKWFWCVAALGLGSKYLSFNHRLLPLANEAVYPVYVLHLPVATLIAYWVVGWNIWPVAQLVIITLGTFVISVFLYAFVIRRTALTRFLFGLKPKREETRADDLAPAPKAAPSRPTPEEGTTPTSV